ncbi:hypothetical protein [Pseudomonas sp. NFX15]|uniref:hypothetical protein n=1 Tax=Pseudomonas sp. NFX15 TaxID=2816958 RepID=UPI003BA368A4
MQTPNLEQLLTQTVEVVIRAGQLLIAEWARVDGPRGQGDKAAVDEETNSSYVSTCCSFFLATSGERKPDIV